METMDISARVVILSTNKRDGLINKHLGADYKTYWLSISNNGNQHLYVISNEQIKDGDWFINNDGLWKCSNNIIPTSKNPRKVIATTDGSLTTKSYINHGKEANKEVDVSLPKPSNEFIQLYIESYNKGEVITDVLVEVENYCEKQKCNDDNYMTKCCNMLQRLKLKDNTIIIKNKSGENKPITLDEMYSNMQYYMEYCESNGYITPQNWIENHKHF